MASFCDLSVPIYPARRYPDRFLSISTDSSDEGSRSYIIQKQHNLLLGQASKYLLGWFQQTTEPLCWESIKSGKSVCLKYRLSPTPIHETNHSTRLFYKVHLWIRLSLRLITNCIYSCANTNPEREMLNQLVSSRCRGGVPTLQSSPGLPSRDQSRPALN